MFGLLAKLLLDARQRVGLDQAQVAAALGVGQQAVSGWERGRSRPRRSMLPAVAKLLNLEEDILVEVGGYAIPASNSDLPPLMRCLPLGSLPPDRFEDLTVEILADRYPGGQASRFGGPGEKQHGIDVLVSGPKGGNLATAQCKRHIMFGEAAVRAAVKAVDIEANDNYLFVSREIASPGARLEMNRHPGWQLWDGEDISRYIRRAPLDRAIRLVDTYFPGYRQAFLGVAQPGPWQLPEEYFAEAVSALVSNGWQLVGRDEQLQELTAHICGPSRALAVVVGRGGIGKTRLLRAIADASTDWAAEVFVLAGDAAVQAASFEQLPSDRRLIVLLDDAHERSDLNAILAGVWRRNGGARILIATRPYRWDAIRHELQRNGMVPDSPLTIELSELLPSDAEKLAREALGDIASDALVIRLASISRDTPLVTVVGGVLARQGRLNLAELQHDQQVRDAILRGFRNAIVADPMVLDPDTRNAVLDAVSAFQPFRSDDDAFKQALVKVVGKPFEVLRKHLCSLEEAGILRRRGASLRIAPDLLGDVILSDASYDAGSGQTTGYLGRVRAYVDGLPLRHLFVNVSRVDWQIRQHDTSIPSMVEALWEPLEVEVRAASITERLELVGLLVRVAYFQPERVVTIARWLIDNPLDEGDEAELVWGRHRPAYRNVLHALSEMLKAAAYTYRTLPAVLNLLWELTQDDTRPTNQTPGHPLRVLIDLAEYELGKPRYFNDAVIDAAETWFEAPHTFSPFEVLAPLLATEGSRETFQEYTFSFQPFPINLAAVMPIRERLLDLALRELKSIDVRRSVGAVNFIGNGLRYPTGRYGRDVEDEERDRWTPSFTGIIERLGVALGSIPEADPVVIVAVRAMLNWHATYSSTATQSAAESVVNGLRNDLADRIALIVHDGWGHLIHQREHHDYETAQARIQERLQSAVSDLQPLPDEAIADLLAERLRQEKQAFGPERSNPGSLISELVVTRPALAQQLLGRAATDGGSAFRPLVPVVLASHAEADAGDALAQARRLLTLNDHDLKRLVAQAFGWHRGRRPLAEGEFELLIEFGNDPAESVRFASAAAVQRLIESDPARACHLLAEIDFSDSSRLADQVFMAFTEPFGLQWERLSLFQRANIRARLIAVPDIGQHCITEFLAKLSANDPDWVVSLLQDRVTRGETTKSLGEYYPVPHHWGTNKLRVREHNSFPLLLRTVHAWIASSSSSRIRREMGAEVFKEVASEYDEAVLPILIQALGSGQMENVDAVAAIVSKAQRTFIWDEPGFVIRALQASKRIGNDCEQRMVQGLWRASISEIRTGTPGRPFQEDIEQRDRSLEIASTLPAGSIEAEFYRDMSASAISSIARSVEKDRVGDGRYW